MLGFYKYRYDLLFHVAINYSNFNLESLLKLMLFLDELAFSFGTYSLAALIITSNAGKSLLHGSRKICFSVEVINIFD